LSYGNKANLFQPCPLPMPLAHGIQHRAAIHKKKPQLDKSCGLLGDTRACAASAN
jgi:hypothetical protein